MSIRYSGANKRRLSPNITVQHAVMLFDPFSVGVTEAAPVWCGPQIALATVRDVGPPYLPSGKSQRWTPASLPHPATMTLFTSCPIVPVLITSIIFVTMLPPTYSIVMDEDDTGEDPHDHTEDADLDNQLLHLKSGGGDATRSFVDPTPPIPLIFLSASDSLDFTAWATSNLPFVVVGAAIVLVMAVYSRRWRQPKQTGGTGIPSPNAAASEVRGDDAPAKARTVSLNGRPTVASHRNLCRITAGATDAGRGSP